MTATASVAEALRAKLAATRAAALEQRRRDHLEALEAFTGACRACLDSGIDAMTQQHCVCGAGRRRREAEALEEERRRALAIETAYTHALAGSGIPPEYAALTLDTYPRKRGAFVDILRYLEAWNGSRGLVLTGSYGTGKTALACEVARRAALLECTADPSARFRIHFATAAALLRELRAAMGDKTGEYKRILDRAVSARILILDDLGRSNPGEWASEVLFDIINARYNARLPLLITSNYAEAELGERLGEHGDAIVDRLGERCIWLALAGSSLRKRATL